ncbi:hypothetical protein MT378_09480, partial [Psychrobacter sp. 16-Bac2893]
MIQKPFPTALISLANFAIDIYKDRFLAIPFNAHFFQIARYQSWVLMQFKNNPKKTSTLD